MQQVNIYPQLWFVPSQVSPVAQQCIYRISWQILNQYAGTFVYSIVLPALS